MSLLNLSGIKRMVAPPDLAIDLGTANTRLSACGRGLLADEPSLLRLDPGANVVEAYGLNAAKLAVVDPQAYYCAPLHAGFVTDVGAAGALLKALLGRSRKIGFWPQRALACLPAGACEAEREALIEASKRAGLAEVYVAPKPLAAAIGAQLDVASPYAHLLVECGAGITEMAVIRAGELVKTAALRVACSDLHQAVSQNVAARYGVLLLAGEAERLTKEVGATNQSDQTREFITTGTDLLSGRAVCLSVTNLDVLFAVENVVETIVDTVAAFVERLEPELACEIIEDGIYLTGGGALLKGFAERLSLATQFDVTIAHEPMRAVINGAQQMLQVSAKTGVWKTA